MTGIMNIYLFTDANSLEGTLDWIVYKERGNIWRTVWIGLFFRGWLSSIKSSSELLIVRLMNHFHIELSNFWNKESSGMNELTE